MDTKIIGICGGRMDYASVAEAGIGWVRLGTSFPWSDKLYGTETEEYRRVKEEMRKAHAAGVRVMGITPLIGGIRWDEEKGKGVWFDGWPQEIMGCRYADDEFYEIIEEVCAWMAKDLEGLVDDLWQIANEMDIDTFRGPYGLEVAKKLAWAEARGIKRVRPQACCGINPAHLGREARILFEECYGEGSPLDYAGIDGYFGSWASGSVEKWIPVIDEIHAITGAKVLVNEWGYSSIGVVKPIPADFVMTGNIGSVCATKTWHNAWKGEAEHTEELQADYLTRGLEILAQHPHALGGFMYCWQDDKICYHCGQPNCPAECGWGIVRSDGSRKPAWFAVRKASEAWYRQP